MKNIYKAVAAVCAMAALMSSVPALPVSADTVTKPMYYAQADMGAATDFNRVNIDFGGSAPDEYTVESSMDGKIWTELTSNVTEKTRLLISASTKLIIATFTRIITHAM